MLNSKTSSPAPWAMPAVFVAIWSTGFVVARFGMPYAPPFKFLFVRFALSLLCFGLWVALAKAPWPRERRQWLHLAVTGVLMQAGYLGGVWAAVRHGMGAGLAALLVGLQPILTAIWLAGRGGRVSARQWAGLTLGLLGLVLVVFNKLGTGHEVTPLTLALAVMALLSITAGTLYQKRHVQPCDVRTASAIQLAAAALVSLPLAALEQAAFQWTAHSTAAMAWSVLALTLGGSSLLYLLIQRGSATSVVSLLYLVPPCTALIAWVLFREPISWLTVAGMAVTAVGVSIVVRAERA